ncbi:putative per-hexamer repeat protein 5 [Trypanosoma conorhini]|uniref:Putative per-hexamer repeat protein 5 n=1 Tax=Trypanosoma conorhini TaxID=83891 RepID=A0A422NS45_9TRYP|nr:putative per-hexamer repeat protein 5 [Trypanosoma conorhini]RNF08312.1 putative per-hexamer repeat protein 5 [Trypanosoma conorhini]
MSLHIVWPLVAALASSSAWTSYASPSPTLDVESTLSREETSASSAFRTVSGISESLLPPTPSETGTVTLSYEQTAQVDPCTGGHCSNSTAVVAGVCSGIAVAFLLLLSTLIVIYCRRKKRGARLAAESNSHEGRTRRVGNEFNPLHGENKEVAIRTSTASNCESSTPRVGGWSVTEEEAVRRERELQKQALQRERELQKQALQREREQAEQAWRRKKELEARQSINMHQRRNLAPDAALRLHALRHRETADAVFGPFLDSDCD